MDRGAAADEAALQEAAEDAAAWSALCEGAAARVARRAAAAGEVAISLLDSEAAPEETHVALLPKPEEDFVAPKVFFAGTVVAICDLRRHMDLNGLPGKVVKYVPQGRYAVATVRGLKLVHECNLVAVTPLLSEGNAVQAFLGHHEAGPTKELKRCYCMFCAEPLSLDVVHNLLLRDSQSSSAMIAHDCGANITYMKTALGPLSDPAVEKGALIVLQVYGGVGGKPFFAPTGGLSVAEAANALVSNAAITNHPDAPMRLRDAMKRLPPREASAVARAGLAAALSLQPGGVQFSTPARAAGVERMERVMRETFVWPKPMPNLPARDEEPRRAARLICPDGSLPMVLFCMWCGRPLVVAGSQPAPGKWCGTFRCLGHGKMVSSSGVAILSHGVLTLSLNSIFAEL